MVGVIYEFVCDQCRLGYESLTFVKIGQPLKPCPECDGELIRVVSLFNCTPVSLNIPHYNHAVGDWVTSTSDFEKKLAEGAKRQSERLGYDQTYAPVYPSEAKAYHEQSASNDKQDGESVERYKRMQPFTTNKKIIV